jgi:phosphoribosylformimino-5-aminoimidazole carboxamide ribotide isomerase
MIVFPALDLRGGRVVRLRQGDPAQQTTYSDDPLAMARVWAEQGAEWLHVVDLDAALEATASGATPSPNRVAAGAIARATGLPVQFGGGLRSVADVLEALELGVARVVVGTLAVSDPAALEECLARCGAEAVVVGIDARMGQVAIRGWRAGTTLQAVTLARRVRAQGVTRIVYTDIVRDGMLSGVNVAETAALAEAADVRVIASGGVSGVENIRQLARAGARIEGVIIGQALYSGALDLRAALDAALDAAQGRAG